MRYIVVEGSQTGHCCFGATVVDTTRPVMMGPEGKEKHYNNEFEPVCECMEEDDANMIAKALNKGE